MMELIELIVRAARQGGIWQDWVSIEDCGGVYRSVHGSTWLYGPLLVAVWEDLDAEGERARWALGLAFTAAMQTSELRDAMSGPLAHVFGYIDAAQFPNLADARDLAITAAGHKLQECADWCRDPYEAARPRMEE
jgi:hypothetical protein